MAVFTDIAGLHVRRTLAGCVRAVVATRAIARDIHVIEVRGQPANGRVTVVAVVAAIDMCRVLAGCRDAVMTRAASAQNLRVIDRKYGRPDVRRMAVFAHVTCLYVCRSLAGRLRAVMAAEAVPCDIDVVEIRGQPASCRVTIVTVIAARDVGRMLTGSREAVMAGAAGARHLRMVHRVRGRPHIAVVAVFTDVAGLNVSQVLASRFHAIVATYAVTRDAHVIEIRRSPARCRVTVITRIATGDMRWVLAGCRDAVMARAAGADHLGVVNGKRGRKNIGVVAVLADITGLDMCRILTRGIGAIVTVDAVASDIDVIKIRR